MNDKDMIDKLVEAGKRLDNEDIPKDKRKAWDGEKIVDIPREAFTLLPPAKDVCQECAAKHKPEDPHNRASLFYQYEFWRKHARWPTWTDAMLHCTENIRTIWRAELKKKGVKC